MLMRRLAASIFHDSIQGLSELKRSLNAHGDVPVRLTGGTAEQAKA